MADEPAEKKPEEELPPGQQSISQPHEDPINHILRKRRIVHSGSYNSLGDYSFLTPAVIHGSTSGVLGTEQQRRVDEDKTVLNRQIAELLEQIQQKDATKEEDEKAKV
jgi:hypothetical protein